MQMANLHLLSLHLQSNVQNKKLHNSRKTKSEWANEIGSRGGKTVLSKGKGDSVLETIFENVLRHGNNIVLFLKESKSFFCFRQLVLFVLGSFMDVAELLYLLVSIPLFKKAVR